MPTPLLPEAFSGLAPVSPARCARCGSATLSFANGRGRLDICEACGSLDVSTPEGIELFSMRDPTLPSRARGRGQHPAAAATRSMHRPST